MSQSAMSFSRYSWGSSSPVRRSRIFIFRSTTTWFWNKWNIIFVKNEIKWRKSNLFKVCKDISLSLFCNPISVFAFRFEFYPFLFVCGCSNGTSFQGTTDHPWSVDIGQLYIQHYQWCSLAGMVHGSLPSSIWLSTLFLWRVTIFFPAFFSLSIILNLRI